MMDPIIAFIVSIYHSGERDLSMRIYGLDFTSAPSDAKPITCAVCDYDGDTLAVQALDCLPDFETFEAFLAQPGPWIAGFDFPFGLPVAALAAWELDRGDWAAMVQAIGALDKAAFLAQIEAFRDARPSGKKHPLRHTDHVAGAISPLMVHGIPVGRMFFTGAPRLLRAGVHVVPCHPTGDPRVALETYPALVARRWLGKRPYKSDTPAKQTRDRLLAREALIAHLHTGARDAFGVAVALPDALARTLSSDPTGDRLDAVLCALQAAWASEQPDYGVPSEVDAAALEGWIVGPLRSGA